MTAIASALEYAYKGLLCSTSAGVLTIYMENPEIPVG